MSKQHLIMLRHGEPQGGTRVRGQQDDPLSPLGWQQMEAAARRIAGIDGMASSTLLRCSEFARRLADERQIPLQHDAGFIEIGFGQWQGYTRKELLETYGDRCNAFWRDPTSWTPPGAESIEAFRSRVCATWDKLLGGLQHERCLLVAHAGVMRMVLCRELGIPLEQFYAIKIPFAGIVHLVIEGEGSERSVDLCYLGPADGFRI